MKKYFFIIFIVAMAVLAGGVLLFESEKRTFLIENEAGEEKYGNKEIEKYADSVASEEKYVDKEIGEYTDSVASEERYGDKEIEKYSDRAAGEEEDENAIEIEDRPVSFGYQTADNRKIDTIVIHSSYDALNDTPYDVGGLIKEYKQYGVAPHYLIDRQGNIYKLVEEKNIAWHAGESKTPDGRTNVNAFSVGIELMNTENDKYTSTEYQALLSLISELKERYGIKYVLGHKDIAKGRKTDPWNMEIENNEIEK